MVTTIDVAKPLSNFLVSLKMLASSCMPIFVLFRKDKFLWHYSFVGNRFLCLFLLTDFHIPFSLDIGFTCVGSCVSSLDPATFLFMYCVGNNGQDVFDEELALIVSNNLPFPLFF